jgi:hypothetical protein
MLHASHAHRPASSNRSSMAIMCAVWLPLNHAHVRLRMLNRGGFPNAGVQDSCPTLLRVYQRAEALWSQAAPIATSPLQSEAATPPEADGVRPEELCSALVCGAELLLEQITTLQPPNLTLGGWSAQLQELPEDAKAAVEMSINPIELLTCEPPRWMATCFSCVLSCLRHGSWVLLLSTACPACVPVIVCSCAIHVTVHTDAMYFQQPCVPAACQACPASLWPCQTDMLHVVHSFLLWHACVRRVSACTPCPQCGLRSERVT